MIQYRYYLSIGVGILKKKVKFILFVSLSINIIGIVLASILLFPRLSSGNVDLPYYENTYFKERTNLFASVEVPENSIVFIGDSITQRGLWNELFPDAKVINRGINSDTTEGVKNRLDEIISDSPKKVFLMVGVNDLYAGLTTDEIVTNYEEILNKFKSGSSETEVFVQSILPLNYEMYYAGDKIKNETIQVLNVQLKELSVKFGYNYIDLYSIFEENGQLNRKLSYDGIHLNGDGYELWEEFIQRYIE